MDMYDSLFSPEFVLNEQIARQLFEIMPSQGPVMVIVGKDGHCWPSDSEKFSKLNISDALLTDICDKIDDGDEPLMTQIDDFSIIAAQLTTDRVNCGYIVVALPQHSPESTLINIDLIEMVLNQVGLIAKLVEKNNMLYELQIRNHPGSPNYSPSEVSLN